MYPLEGHTHYINTTKCDPSNVRLPPFLIHTILILFIYEFVFNILTQFLSIFPQ